MRPALPVLSRRQLLLASLATTLPAGAQTTAWPNKPLRLVCGLSPGGLAVMMCRVAEPLLAAALGRTRIVDIN